MDASDYAIAQAFREAAMHGASYSTWGQARNAIIDRAAKIRAATPPAGAGEAVAFRFLGPVGSALAWSRWFGIDELHHYAADGNLAAGPSPLWSRLEYAYAAPTPLPEAVRELVGRWRERANRNAADGWYGAAQLLRSHADELDALAHKGNEHG